MHHRRPLSSRRRRRRNPGSRPPVLEDPLLPNAPSPSHNPPLVVSPRGDLELLEYSFQSPEDPYDTRSSTPTTSFSLYQPPAPLVVAEKMERGGDEQRGHNNNAHVFRNTNRGDGSRVSPSSHSRQHPSQSFVPSFSSPKNHPSPGQSFHHPATNHTVVRQGSSRPQRLHHPDTTTTTTGALTVYSSPICSRGFLCCQCVRTNELGIVEDCGRFQEMVGPGLYLQPWPWTGITTRISLRVQSLTLSLYCLTKDQVSCQIQVVVLYRVSAPRAYQTYYRLDHVTTFLTALITDEIRARVAGTVLEELFTHSPTTLATPVLDALVRTLLIEYGVQLHKLLVTRIRPDPVVRSALNEIPARRRETWAASHQAEAHKVEVVARAQAHAERLSLLGRGTARQRRVLLEQFWYESVHEWIHNVYLAPPQVPSTQDLLTLLLITQYLDVITAVGAPKKPHTSDHAAQQQQDTKESCLVLHHNDFGRPLQSPLAAAAAASLRAVTNTRRDSDTHRASSSSSSSSYHKDMLQLIPAATTT